MYSAALAHDYYTNLTICTVLPSHITIILILLCLQYCPLPRVATICWCGCQMGYQIKFKLLLTCTGLYTDINTDRANPWYKYFHTPFYCRNPSRIEVCAASLEKDANIVTLPAKDSIDMRIKRWSKDDIWSLTFCLICRFPLLSTIMPVRLSNCYVIL